MADNFINRFFGIASTPAAPDTKAAPAIEEKSLNSANLLDLLREENNTAGESVNLNSALQVAAVFACARVISEGLAQVPCKVLRDDEQLGPVEDKAHPLFDLLRCSPNDWQTSFEFREQLGLHLVLANNAFVKVTRNTKGQPIELYAFDPASVTVKQNSDYTLTYRVATGKRKTIDYVDVPQEEMWHLRGPSWNGYQGLDAVDVARRTIGLSLATEKYGAKLFENAARPGGLLTTDQKLTPEQQDQLRKAWQAQQSGANQHKTALLGGGLKYTAIASTANEAQWTEARRYQVEEVCRYFRVRPAMVMQTTGHSSYNSVEQEFLAHLTHTLMPWFERFEQSASKHLLTPAERQQGYCVKLDSVGMHRGSIAERMKYYQTGQQGGWLSQNDVRRAESLPRITDPEADEYHLAQNLFGDVADTSNDAPAAPPPSNDPEVNH